MAVRCAVVILGASTPFVVLLISIIALAWATEPSVLIATLCEKVVANKNAHITINKGFIIKILS